LHLSNEELSDDPDDIGANFIEEPNSEDENSSENDDENSLADSLSF
jgi:hypothetical protein